MFINMSIKASLKGAETLLLYFNLLVVLWRLKKINCSEKLQWPSTSLFGNKTQDLLPPNYILLVNNNLQCLLISVWPGEGKEIFSLVLIHPVFFLQAFITIDKLEKVLLGLIGFLRESNQCRFLSKSARRIFPSQGITKGNLKSF